VKQLLALLFFFFVTQSFGQQYNFKNYTVQDGLAQSQINSIQQDLSGYLWIGTESGLSRFDGINFINYSVDDGLPDNKIEAIFISEQNEIWIATPKGLALYEDDKFESHLFDEPKRVNDLIEFQSNIYVATDKGLVKFKDDVFTLLPFDLDEELYLRSLENDQDNRLYCGSKNGIYTWTNHFEKINHPNLESLSVSGLKIRNNELLVSTYRDGLLSYNLVEKSVKSFDLNLSRIRSMYADDEVILCSTIDGAVEIKGDEITYFNENNGLKSGRLICSFRDREQNYWFGSDGIGLLKFLGKALISYTVKDGLSSNLVMNINQDKNGNFLFGTYSEGLTIKKDEDYEYLSNKNGLPNSSVWSTLVDDENNYWIATSSGVDCFKDGKKVNQEITSLIDTKIRSIIQFDSSFAFAGTNGIYYLSNNELVHLESTTDLNVNDLCYEKNTIYIASRNGLYFVTEDEGFNNPQKIELEEESINSVECDNNQNLWIGTNNGLFVKLREQGIVPILLDAEDFKSKTVIGITSAKSGDIWAATMNGVYQITSEENSENSYEISHYGSAEGLINLESNLNAIYEDTYGMIWIGTSNGLAKINPELKEELFNVHAPYLRFTGIRLFMEDFDYDRFEASYQEGRSIPTELTLPYNQNHLTFDFIGINLKDPESVSYEYRLLGANYSWSPLSNSNTATYSSIAPGEYDFELRATNKNFIWSATESIHITIKSPFWKTWWFILLMFFAAGFIILQIFRIRIRSIKQKQENEKLGFQNRLLFLEQQSLNASMNRHFIFNSLNSIQYYINSSDKRSANKYLSSFAKLIRKNLDSSTANNFIVSLQEEIDRIKLYLTLEKMRFQEKFEYELEVDSSIDTEGIEIPSMILQPFVENAIIHGVLPLERKGLITVRIYDEYGDIVFEVIDDGVGIDNTLKNKKVSISGDHESKGMEITNRRIELLRKLTGDNLLIVGPFQLNDTEGNSLGTKVTIKMGIKSE